MRVIERDITTVEEGIVAHQVNCQGTIGAGVSGAICRKWPEAERAYRAFCAEAASPESLLGSFCHVDVAPGLTVVHVFGQLDYGDGSEEAALSALFDEYGLYMEYGEAWSFALYPEP